MTGYRSTFRRIVVSAFALGLAIFGLTIFSLADSTTTRAARLTSMQGTVTVSESGGTSVPAQLNLPLLSGVQVSTGDDGQAEVEFEDGSVVRLTPNSALSLDKLAVDPSGVFTTDLSLLHGLAYLELRATPQYRYSLNAGGDVLSPVENTTVRVNMDAPPAAFAVLDGTAHVERQNTANGYGTGSSYQTDVRAGETLRADSADTSRYFLTQGIDADSWDQWNQDMDQAAAAQSTESTDVRNNYAGAQGYGWSDMDANGNWYDVPGTGPVWQPNAAVDSSDFDPFGDGSWVAYPGVGYLWASAYPWGWTPYRCGNWSFFHGFGWGWAPGTGCGGFGWGFIGGGRPVNIVSAPANYRPIRVPEPGHGPERPWIAVHSGNAPVVESRPVERGPRQIAGVTASPIKPVGNSFNSGEGAAGSSLRRDFPVDAKTRTPVMGLASTRPAVVYTIPAQPGREIRPVNPGVVQPSGSHPVYNGQYRPTPGAAAGSTPAQGQRPANEPGTPYQRNPPAGTPQPEHRTYTPPTSSQQAQPQPRTYYPPPSSQPHPAYTPPPPPPVSHPTYSPPPPPPPPPAEHSAPAAPAPSNSGSHPR